MNSQKRTLPLVTVITPAYNRATFLDETILSVLGQDYQDLEYMVLDDGSSDNTREIAAKYSDRIKYDRHDNMGEARTVNKGLSMARGEIVGVVNSDDPLLSGAVSSIVAEMLARPDVLVIYPDWYVIDSEGRKVEIRRTLEYSYANMVRWHCCIPGPGAFFRRSLIDQIGGRDPQLRYTSDFDFFLRAGLIGPFARVPKALATFRWHQDGASSREKGFEMAKEHIRLVDKLFSSPGLPKEMLSLRNEAYSNAYYEAAVALGDSHLRAKKQYFMKALKLAPKGYLLEYRHKLPEPLVLILLGMKAYVSIKAIYRAIARRKKRKRLGN